MVNFTKKLIIKESVSNKDDLFNLIVNFSYENDFIADKKLVKKGLLDREAAGNTLITENIALPHIQSKSVIRSHIIIYSSRHYINWNNHPIGNICFIILGENVRKDSFEIIKNLIHDLVFTDKIKEFQNEFEHMLYLKIIE